MSCLGDDVLFVHAAWLLEGLAALRASQLHCTTVRYSAGSTRSWAGKSFGSSATKAARIEPVTPPGMVYASEAFAATLAAGGQAAYALEYVGLLPLAKGRGESRIYRLERR